MNSDTLTWWSLLCGVSAINVLVWLRSAWALHNQSDGIPSHQWPEVKWHMVLSAGYVIGCGYRCVFPVYDVQRIVMFDSWLSSVIVGRSVATVAELCFAAQWALLLRSVAQSCGSAPAFQVSRLIFPMIVVAEVCSWYAVLTTSNLGHVLEESLWGLSAALLVGSFVLVWPRCNRAIRPILLIAGAIGLPYVVYMFKVDVPMYWARWVFDEGRGHQYLSIAQGVADASGRWIVSHNWKDWESEVVWMSIYFSVAVWLSIGLMHFAGTSAGSGRQSLIAQNVARPLRRKALSKNPLPS